MRNVLPAHGRVDHRANGPDPIPVLVHIKVFADSDIVAAGDDARRFVVTDDLGGTYIRKVNATVTTVSTSGSISVQVHNLTTADDVLSTNASIQVGETTSFFGTQGRADITGDPPVNYVTAGDILRVDVDSAGTNAAGLEALIEFGPQIIRLT